MSVMTLMFRTMFSVRGGLQPRALVSYPGSGNTWIRSPSGSLDWLITHITVRYLIEASSGLFTGSVYRDKSILRWVSQCWLLVSVL